MFTFIRHNGGRGYYHHLTGLYFGALSIKVCFKVLFKVNAQYGNIFLGYTRFSSTFRGVSYMPNILFWGKQYMLGLSLCSKKYL